MPLPNALLGRLLPLLAPVATLTATAVTGCGKAGPPGPIEPNGPGKRFDVGAEPSPVATTPPRLLGPCSSVFFVKKNPMRTGGPYRMPACYIQSSVGGAPVGACLPADSPRLAEAIPSAAYAECVERGPLSQKDKASGEPTCCYVLGAMGEGRPFLVRQEAKTAEASPRLRRLVAPLVLLGAQNTWT